MNSFQVSSGWGLSPDARQIRDTAVWLSPIARAPSTRSTNNWPLIGWSGFEGGHDDRHYLRVGDLPRGTGPGERRVAGPVGPVGLAQQQVTLRCRCVTNVKAVCGCSAMLLERHHQTASRAGYRHAQPHDFRVLQFCVPWERLIFVST